MLDTWLVIDCTVKEKESNRSSYHLKELFKTEKRDSISRKSHVNLLITKWKNKK